MSQIERRGFVSGADAGALGRSGTLLTSQVNGQPHLGTWPNRRLLDLCKIEHPTVHPQPQKHQAPFEPLLHLCVPTLR
jgi:hypothetical protein